MDLHIEAKANFNRKGTEILSSIGINNEVRRKVSDNYSPDIHISETLGPENIIGDIDYSNKNEDDIIIARWFTDGSTRVGVNEENYKKLRQLAENIQKNKIYRDSLSLEFVEDTIFNWVKFTHQKTVNCNMMDYVKEKCKEAIKEQEIWIPVSGLHIEEDLIVGNIVIKTITHNMLDEWIDRARQYVPSKLTEAQFEDYSQKERKKIQGFAAIVAKVYAEPRRASDVSYKLAEESLAILRVFSHYNLSPKRVCYCTPLGRENVQTYKYYHVHNERLVHEKKGVLDTNYQPWFLNKQGITMLRESGLDILGEVLRLTEKTKFQEAVLSSIMMYSKSCLMSEPSDKLVYILVALESLILKNENEPIQQNIAERIAFAVAETKEDRRRIVKLVKEIYGLRSRFIHHGQSIKDTEELKKFMFEAFMFFVNISMNINKFNTKEEFIDMLEEMKFS